MGGELVPLRQVLVPEVLDAWCEEAAFASVLDRLEVLSACGPVPSASPTSWAAIGRIRALRARRAAWEAYLDAAAACDVINHGRLARLRGVPDDDFRTAVAECLAVWFFAGWLRWNILPQPLTSGRPFELRIPNRN